MRTYRFAQGMLSIGVLLLLTGITRQSAAHEITIVSPNGLDRVEGNGLAGPSGSGYREQDSRYDKTECACVSVHIHPGTDHDYSGCPWSVRPVPDGSGKEEAEDMRLQAG